MASLKENYESKKLNELKTKVREREKILMENEPDYHAAILLEALDADEYREATEIIEKLRGISEEAKNVGLKMMPAAIEECIKDVNEFTGGGMLKRGAGRLASLFSRSAPSKNPVIKAISFASALEAGFNSLRDVLKNNIKDIKDRSDETIVIMTKNDPRVQKTISDTLIKSFVPEGIFGKVFNVIPYIKDPKKLVAEIMMLTPNQINSMYRRVETGPQAKDLPPEIADQKANKEAAQEMKDSGEDGERGDSSAKSTTGQTRKVIIKATQDAAKKAGVSDGKALTALMKKLNYEVGSYEASLVVPALQELMADKNIPDDQTDGFIRGLMADFEKDFKSTIDKKIKDKLTKMKKAAEEKAKKSDENPEDALTKTLVFNTKAKGQGGEGTSLN